MSKQEEAILQQQQQGGGLEEGGGEEYLEDEAGEDPFFESLDRVASGVSFDFEFPTSGSGSGSDSDEEDDVRISFASAMAPPSFRRISLADFDEFDDNADNNSNNNHDLDGTGGGGGGGDYDYGIWMAEPMSIKERRRRLLQGMGLTSGKDLAARSRRMSHLNPAAASLRLASHRFAAAAAAAAADVPVAPSPAPQQPPPPPSSPPVTGIARSRSDSQLAVARRGPAGALFRCSSAPPSLWDPPESRRRRRRWGGGGGGVASGGGGGDELGGGVDGGRDALGLCKIKNLDTGKEFVVTDVGNSLNDLQTGLQLTIEEFEKCLGFSPIVKELMRRVNMGGGGGGGGADKKMNGEIIAAAGRRAKSSKSRTGGGSSRKKGGWLKNIKFVASSVTGLISEKDKDCGSAASGRPPLDGNASTTSTSASNTTSSSSSSSSSTEWMKVRHHGKSHKELTGLYMCQDIQAHQGSIWSIKFSSDSLYLASAGEDRVVHVWQVIERDSLHRQDANSSTTNGSAPSATQHSSKRTKKGKASSGSTRSSVPDYIVMPETVFSLSDKPVCSFHGHLDDVLDLSWSKSQHLLSSSMDKTVRLWDMETKACLKLFAHNDYVTCIQFNPVDDRYFISGSLDAKVRIWSIPDRQVVDWSELHEMVTATCYTPDGQGALVGSHKGSCRFYNTSDCKLYQEGQMDIRSKKKKSHAKKITGFQFAPDNPSEVMITSADSQIRVFDGVDMIHKFRGFRNTSSQISASFSLDGKYVVCASEDSHVYIWKRRAVRNASAGGRSKGWVTTRSHEHFYCKDVSVAIPWPSSGSNCEPPSLPSWSKRHIDSQHLSFSDSQRSTMSGLEDIFPSSRSDCPAPLPKVPPENALPCTEDLCHASLSGPSMGSSSSFLSASASSASLQSAAIASGASSASSLSSWRWGYGGSSRMSTSNLEASNAWGMVVVTAGLGGNIRIYQNFGLPLRLNRQANLF